MSANDANNFNDSAPQPTKAEPTYSSVSEQLAMRSDAWLEFQRVAMIGQLTPYIVHELVQPLSSICNFASGLLHKFSSDALPKEQLAEVLGTINHEAYRASDIAKLLRGNPKSDIHEHYNISINDSMRRALELAGGFLHAQQISLSIALAEGLPCVSANATAVEQMILNLIKNAAEAMGVLQRHARVLEVSTCESDGFVEIAFKDCGLPILEDSYLHLTSPFFSTKPSALGLGLWACKTIIEKHGGELQFRQVSPQGLEAVVRLPISHPIL